MYEGHYNQDFINFKKVLDHKRIEKEEVDVFLYSADYEVLNYNGEKETLESRVLKFVYNDGRIEYGVNYGMYNGDINNLDKLNSTKDFTAFWCPEKYVPTPEDEYPTKIIINGKCVNDTALKEWAKSDIGDFKDKFIKFNSKWKNKIFDEMDYLNGSLSQSKLHEKLLDIQAILLDKIEFIKHEKTIEKKEKELVESNKLLSEKFKDYEQTKGKIKLFDEINKLITSITKTDTENKNKTTLDYAEHKYDKGETMLLLYLKICEIAEVAPRNYLRFLAKKMDQNYLTLLEAKKIKQNNNQR